MIRSYELIINSENNVINGQIFNVGFENQSVNDLAKAVKEEIGDDVEIVKSHSDDNRSYHISSKIFDALKFKAEFTKMMQ